MWRGRGDIRKSFLGGIVLLGLCVLTSSAHAQLLAANKFAPFGYDTFNPSFPIVFPLVAPDISSRFGNRIHPILGFSGQHSGVDLAAPLGSHVRTVADGVVIFADRYAGYGKLVSIRHKSGYVSVYGHLSELLVNPGDRIKAGTLIGRVGSTGMSTGPHLHFEWRVHGIPRDPLSIFPDLATPASG